MARKPKRRSAHATRNLQALDALGAFTSEEHGYDAVLHGKPTPLQEVDQHKAEQKPVDE